MKTLRPFLFSLLLFGLFSAVPSAYAHRPEEGAQSGLTEIPDPTTSFAYYRNFDGGDFAHLYEVDGTGGQAFHAGINIPQLEGLESYGVSLALFGPGLPEVDPAGLPAAAADLAGQGGLMVESRVSEDFYEPFTQTNYWGRQSLDVTFPETGTYYLAIWQPDGAPGKYVLDTGREEVFGPGDILRFPVWWWNTRAYFDQLPNLWLPALAILAVITAAGGIVLYRRRTTLATRFA